MKKIMKASLAIALAFGGVSALCGCFKNNDTTQTEKTEQEKVYDLYVKYMEAKGETPASYQDWLKSIKGENGKDGKNGVNGAAWHKGEGVPVSVSGAVKGDYYLDTKNQDIYFLGSNGWEKTLDLNNKSALEKGKYIYTQENDDGNLVATIEVGVNGELTYSKVKQSAQLEADTDFVYSSMLGLGIIPVSVDNTNNTITLGLIISISSFNPLRICFPSPM